MTISSLGAASNFGDLDPARGGSTATSDATGQRGVIAGGSGPTNDIQKVTISSTSGPTSSTFGDLTVAREAPASTSNA